MSVIEKLRQIVVEQWQPNGVEFRYMSMAQANEEVDKIDGDVIIVECPDLGTLTPMQGRVVDRPTFRIWFLTPMADADGNRYDEDALMQHCKTLAAHFIKEVNESGLFEQIPLKVAIPYVTEYCVFDRAETGIGIDLSLQELQGISVCGKYPEEEEIGTNSEGSGETLNEL